MNYKEALDYLYYNLPMFQRQGKKAFKKDLKNINALLDRLGRPEKSFKSIHIAGTNGKGTSAHLLAAMLQVNDLKIGMYTSPHYKDFRERIKINGSFVSKKFVKGYVTKIAQIVEEDKIQASFFEITVAMAFEYFKQEAVDFAIIETGLGGRLDSTNVLEPEICLITNISLDHTAFLGDTLELIAGEKAGIIKPNIPVIIGERQAAVTEVFKQKAKSVSAPISWAKKYSSDDLSNQADPFFQKNVSSAMSVYLMVAKKYQLTCEIKKLDQQINQYKRLTNYIGRWQILNEKPLTIADSAHNVAGLKAVFKYIKSLEFDKLHIVFGTVGDKDPSKIYALLPKEAKYYFVAAKIPRAKVVGQLASELNQLGLEGKSYLSVKTGLSIAKRQANKNDLIMVLGSIFVVAEVV